MEKERQNNKAKYEDSLKKPKISFIKIDNTEKIERIRKKWQLSQMMADKLRNNHLLGLCGVNSIHSLLYEKILPILVDV